MELDLRDWLLMVGPLFVIGVLLHGYWRMRSNQGELRMSLDKSFLNTGTDEENADELSLLKAELPNGGARVIAEQAALDLDQEVPLLLEPVADPALDEQAIEDAARAIEAEMAKTPDPLDTPAPLTAAPPARKSVPQEKPEKFVVLIVQAQEMFSGEDLVAAFAANDLEFGEMDIFHRIGETGASMFSVVNAVEPGTFLPEAIAELQTPAITLFMRAHECDDPVEVFDDMAATALHLAGELGGQVCDDTRSVATDQTFEHLKQGLRDFQFRHSA